MDEEQRIKEEFKRINRTGRQPTLHQTREQKQRREDRVSGRSVEESSQDYTDSSSFNNPNNCMVIPEMSDDGIKSGD